MKHSLRHPSGWTPFLGKQLTKMLAPGAVCDVTCMPFARHETARVCREYRAYTLDIPTAAKLYPQSSS